jgi:hypothetical protein
MEQENTDFDIIEECQHDVVVKMDALRAAYDEPTGNLKNALQAAYDETTGCLKDVLLAAPNEPTGSLKVSKDEVLFAPFIGSMWELPLSALLWLNS